MKKLFAILLLFASAVHAQPFGGIRTPNDTLHSVKVLPDNQVVLSIYAPKADVVKVSGDFPGGFPGADLIKSDNGVWSVLLKDVAPDVYTYDFNLDGVKTFDPKNPVYKEGENGLSNLFEVAGKESEYCAVKNVPHGKVEKIWFRSGRLFNRCF